MNAPGSNVDGRVKNLNMNKKGITNLKDPKDNSDAQQKNTLILLHMIF